MAEIILGLMGGLGLFLFGMKQMSDGLEKVAGAKMRSILEFFTKTPIRGILVGTFFTAIIQSSSASTVTYEPVSGSRCNHGCQHWNNRNVSVNII